MNIKQLLIALPLTLAALPAQALPFPRVPHHIAEDLPCFMHTQQGSLDLTRLCGAAPLTPANTPAAQGSSPAPARSSGASPSGSCQFASDIAADGSRCGARAASERPGGR